jgi:DNA-binding NtrC family response regulator
MWQGVRAQLAQMLGLFRQRDHLCLSLSQPGAIPSPTTHTSIVGLALEADDQLLLAEISLRNQWDISFTRTCEEATAEAHRTGAQMVVCDRDLPDPEWKHTVKHLSMRRPGTCIILVSAVVDDYLWTEVLRVGGYDVLSKPLREDEVLRAVKLARSYWESANRPAAIPSKKPRSAVRQ